jgi:hypothetical protein
MPSYGHRNDDVTQAFGDRVNSPAQLTNRLAALAISDIAKTASIAHSGSSGPLSDLMRLVFRGQPKSYRWDPRPQGN